jgi:hypothetical protein
MKLKSIICGLASMAFSVGASAQIRIKENDAIKFVGKNVEVLGRVYYLRSTHHDDATLKIGYGDESARLIVYFRFKAAATLASLINKEFGHFIGTIVIEKGRPVLVVNKLLNAKCYKPQNGVKLNNCGEREKVFVLRGKTNTQKNCKTLTKRWPG